MARRSMGLTFTVRGTLSSVGVVSVTHSRNIHVDIHDTIEHNDNDNDNDKVVARWTMAMTHTGAFLGIAPANKRVVNGMSIQHFVNRQISAGRHHRDQLSAGSSRSRTGAQVFGKVSLVYSPLSG
jgi:hypothetical protein